MLIIIEGANKCGKSTLVKTIQNNYPEMNFEVIKVSQPYIEDGINYALTQYNEILDKVEKNQYNNYIIDRFHFGSFVYGPIYRNKTDFSYEDFYNLEDRIMKFKHIFILCLASQSFMNTKFIEENEDFAKIDKIKEEISHFKDIKKYSRLRIFEHNLPKNDITRKILLEIKNYDN